MKAVAIMSGGIDSSTLVYYMKSKGYETHALTFDYGQTHKKEIDYARGIATEAEIGWQLIDISDIQKLLKSSLTNKLIEIPKEHYTNLSQKLTVVPNRNMIFLSIGAGYAQSIGANAVWYGAHYNDRTIYPDCRIEFVRSLSWAIQDATEKKVYLEAPFISLTKAGIIALGKELKVPYEKTWSCYEGEERPCLKCGTCRERTEAFNINKIKDPLLTDEEWFEALTYVK